MGCGVEALVKRTPALRCAEESVLSAEKPGLVITGCGPGGR